MAWQSERSFRVTATICLAVLACSTVPATSAEKDAPKQITSVEGITEYQLENGLKVLLFPDPSKPTVTVNLTIFVGSRHEGYGEAGMAHLLEHMLFKGTPSFPDVPKVLQGHGAQFNGTTWLDRTNYYETMPAGDENLDFALKLEADRMMNSFVKGEDLASEMSVVRNEFERGENNPTSVLWQRMMSAAFQWHNYGQSTIGNRADIERVPIERLQRFYKKYYQPDNAMLVVAGEFDSENALSLIQKYFGSIPAPKRQLDQTYTEEPAQDGERLVTLRRVGDVAAVGAVYHIPAGPHPEYPAIDVLEGILTAPPSGRLYKKLVETKRASDISGAAFALHDPGVMLLLAEVAGENEPRIVLDAMLDEIENVRENGVSEEEVERVKRRLLKQWETSAANSRGIAIQLSEWAAQGDWRLYFLYRDRVGEVTKEDVQAVAQKYLQQNNRTVGMYLPVEKPSRVSIPATPLLTEMIGDYQGREKIATGEAFDVSPQNIDSRTERLTLPSGIEAAFLPKKTRGESVNVRLVLRYGNLKNLKGLATVSDFLPSLMTRGTKKLSRQQLQDELDRNKASLRAFAPSFSSGIVAFTIETKRDNLVAVLDLLRQVLREPTFPEEELEILKNQQLSSLEQGKTDPQRIAVKTVSRKLNDYPKDDPRYVATFEEEIERINALDVKAIRQLYEEYLGAAHGELTIVGDFDPAETRTAVEELLSGWNSEKPYEHIGRVVNEKAKPTTEFVLTPDKANSMYFSATTFPMNDAHPDYPALLIGNYVLGAGALSSRLGNRVRQKEGLSYGVASTVSASADDDRGLFYIYAISNPQNTKRVHEVVQEELKLLLEKGITEEELQSAKEGYLESFKVSRTSDSSLAGTLARLLHVGRTMEYQANLEQNIADLTPEEVVAALRKHIDPKKLVTVAAGDFEAAAAKKTTGTDTK